MKNRSTIILFTVFLILSFQSFAQSLKGNGNVIEQKYEVASFEKLSIDGVFNTWIKQGNENLVTVETDENLIATIEIVEQNNELIVRSKKKTNIKKTTKMNVYITLTEVENVNIAGVGNVKCDTPLNLNKLNLKVSSVGNTSINLNCAKLTGEFTGVGNINFEGAAESANLKISGTGNLDALDFEVEDLVVNNSSIGNVKIYASKTLEINSSGIGNLQYKGDAELKNFDISGIGKVKKLKE